MFYNNIKPSDHYLANHIDEVPWHEAVEVIFKAKSKRKKKNKI